MAKVWAWFDGKKTYVASVASVALGVGQIATGITNHDASLVWSGAQAVTGGLCLGAFRHALAKS